MKRDRIVRLLKADGERDSGKITRLEWLLIMIEEYALELRSVREDVTDDGRQISKYVDRIECYSDEARDLIHGYTGKLPKIVWRNIVEHDMFIQEETPDGVPFTTALYGVPSCMHRHGHWMSENDWSV